MQCPRSRATSRRPRADFAHAHGLKSELCIKLFDFCINIGHLFASSQGTLPWTVQKTEYSAPRPPTAPSQTTKRRGYSKVAGRRKAETAATTPPVIDSPSAMAVDGRLRTTTARSQRYAFFQSLLNTPKNARWEVHHLSAAGGMPWLYPSRGIDAAQKAPPRVARRGQRQVKRLYAYGRRTTKLG